MTVLCQRPEAKPSTASAQRRLRPLLVVRVETGEVFEARADVVVEGAQSIGVES